MAEAAYRWSQEKRWNSLANRLPVWLGIGGVIVGLIGVLGWMSTSTARTLRAVYSDDPAAPVRPPNPDYTRSSS